MEPVNNASRAVKEGGKIILLAPCPEGLGDERFRYWVTKSNVADVYSELRGSIEVAPKLDVADARLSSS